MIQKRNFLTYLLLSFVTCGIYSIYFWYCWTEDVNKLCAGDGKDSQNYIVVLLLSFVTCGIYGFWWYYTQSDRLFANAPRYGKTFTENGTTILLWMVLGAFLFGIGPVIAFYIIINNTNTLAAEYNKNIPGTYTVNP